MPRPLRIQAAGAIYHVAARGNSGRPVFLDDQDRKLFLTLLGLTVARYGWHCYGFCLMSTHYHVLVMTPEANLARGMQFLNGLYAQRFNKRHANEGHVFRGRYQSTLVEGDGHFVELCRYLPRNPIRAGMCKAAGGLAVEQLSSDDRPRQSPDVSHRGPDSRAVLHVGGNGAEEVRRFR